MCIRGPKDIKTIENVGNEYCYELDDMSIKTPPHNKNCDDDETGSKVVDNKTGGDGDGDGGGDNHIHIGHIPSSILSPHLHSISYFLNSHPQSDNHTGLLKVCRNAMKQVKKSQQSLSSSSSLSIYLGDEDST